MTKIQKLLREYNDRCWQKLPNEQRFVFDTSDECDLFIRRLEELDASFLHYGFQRDGYKVEVYL
jgi:hypothetical protein